MTGWNAHSDLEGVELPSDRPGADEQERAKSLPSITKEQEIAASEAWLGDLQDALERAADVAPNEDCKLFVTNLLRETYDIEFAIEAEKHEPAREERKALSDALADIRRQLDETVPG